MTIVDNTVDLLKESLPEMIVAAKYCVEYNKNAGENLGWPAAVLLFSIIDAIGSYFFNDNTLNIIIDGDKKTIKGTNQHFYILNSEYFNLNLSLEVINNIYKNYRCTLLHNASLPINHYMEVGQKGGSLITYKKKDGKSYPIMNTVPLFESCEKAVSEFIKHINNISGKQQVARIEKKKW